MTQKSQAGIRSFGDSMIIHSFERVQKGDPYCILFSLFPHLLKSFSFRILLPSQHEVLSCEYYDSSSERKSSLVLITAFPHLITLHQPLLLSLVSVAVALPLEIRATIPDPVNDPFYTPPQGFENAKLGDILATREGKFLLVS